MYFVIKELTLTVSSRKTEDGSSSLSPVSGLRSSDSGLLTFIIIHFLIITGLIQAVWGLLQLYGITRSFHSGFKITGTFFNPAPYALYLAAIFPLALGTLLGMDKLKIKELSINNEKITPAGPMTAQPNDARSANDNRMTPAGQMTLIHKFTYYISLLTVIAIILVLPATMNRASWLGAAAGSLFVFNYRYNLLKKAKAVLHNTARKFFAVAIVILLIGVSVAGLYFLKKGSSTGKLLIWEVTVGKIAERPLFGHGVGRFEAEYNNWQAGYFKSNPNEMDGPKGFAAGNTKYCFNEYLEMASELGLIGLLLFLAVIASIFLGIRKGIMTTNDVRSTNDNRMTAQPNDAKRMTPKANDYQNSLIPSLLISSLISLLVCALISFPFYSLPTFIVFFLLLAILSSRVKGISVSERLMGSSIIRRFTRVSTHSTLSTCSTFSIFLTLSVLLLFMARQQYKAYSIWNEAVMLYQTGSYGEACKSFSEVYKPMWYTGSYLQYYGKALNMNEEYPQSIEMLQRATQFTSDEILYTTLGDTYKALKRYSEAEEAYRHASFMVPHKLYPLYLLATLYDETGQREKAVAVAREVLQKEIKVESEATEEIRLKMKSIIEKRK